MLCWSLQNIRKYASCFTLYHKLYIAIQWKTLLKSRKHPKVRFLFYFISQIIYSYTMECFAKVYKISESTLLVLFYIKNYISLYLVMLCSSLQNIRKYASWFILSHKLYIAIPWNPLLKSTKHPKKRFLFYPISQIIYSYTMECSAEVYKTSKSTLLVLFYITNYT